MKTTKSKAKSKTHVRKEFRRQGKKVVFTNGCFDLLHYGHIHTLAEAGKLGDVLFVAVNSDRSVRTIKEEDRPIIPEKERAEVLASFAVVDYVLIFDEPDPGRVIERLVPDVLAKGGDWDENAIIGREVVEKNGGRVVRIPLIEGRSTTNIIEKINGLKSE